MAGMATERIELEVGDRVVKISNPDRVYFSARGETKLDLARYYLSVSDGIVNALYHRPCMLHRFPDGVDGEKVHQKRLPHGAPPWIETVRVHFPRFNRDADELCVTHPADVIWAVQMSTVEFHPWNSRRDDVESPDEWRIDLDPMPVAKYDDVRRVSVIVRGLLEELGAVGYPKTSGGKGLHIYVRIIPDHGHPDVRRAAWAFAREVERRAGDLVDLTWWRKDRDPGSVFVDYNQNARDHTIASAYSVRGTPEGVARHLYSGKRLPTRIPKISPSPPCLPGTPKLVIFTPISTITRIGSISFWSGPIGTSATRLCPTEWGPTEWGLTE